LFITEINQIKSIAAKERRSFAQMLRILTEEAIEARIESEDFEKNVGSFSS